MTTPASSTFVTRTLDELQIEDRTSFLHVGLYRELEAVLRRDRYAFRVLEGPQAGRWDRALCLNLTFWGADTGGDVLVSRHLPADVVAHVAWHHLAARAWRERRGDASPSADQLFLAEAIASAFDVYLVGRLLGHAPESSFLESQVAAMSDAAGEAGLDEAAFEAMLEAIAKDPELAFEDLRALLFDVTRQLAACSGATAALEVFDRHDSHRFASLLHRFELSNWVLYARAYAAGSLAPDPDVVAIDRELRGDEGGLAWLTKRWLESPPSKSSYR